MRSACIHVVVDAAVTAGVGACHDALLVKPTPAVHTEGEVERPPLGSWPLTYQLVCVCAVLVIALLWWMSSAFDPRRSA